MSGFSQPTYTQIPNDLLGWWGDDGAEPGYVADMGLAELKVTLVICRYTFGFQRKQAYLSLSVLETATGLSRQGVLDGIAAAQKRGLIRKHKTKGTTVWEVVVKPVDQTAPGSSQASRPYKEKGLKEKSKRSSAQSAGEEREHEQERTSIQDLRTNTDRAEGSREGKSTGDENGHGISEVEGSGGHPPSIPDREGEEQYAGEVERNGRSVGRGSKGDRRRVDEGVQYVDDPFETPMPEIQRVLANNKRKVTPNQVRKLMAGVPKHNPKYQSPEVLLQTDPDFELYLQEKIGWANGGNGDGKKPTGSLVSAICNYEAPYHGWLEWKQRRADDGRPGNGPNNGGRNPKDRGQQEGGATEGYREQLKQFFEGGQ